MLQGFKVFRITTKEIIIGFFILFAGIYSFAQPNRLYVENIDKNKVKLNSSEKDALSRTESEWVEVLKNNTLFTNTSTPQSEIIDSVSEEKLRLRLDKLNTKTPIDIDYNPVVHAYVERYLRMGSYFQRVMGLAEFYYPLFEEKLAQYDIPDEIKHLAIVESKLDARANSRVGAKGLWQFMYQTGKSMGLEVNSYVDERYDPIKSTEAAAKYLKYLHDNVGDWNLALASYNCGLGNVNKAVNRSGGQKNYWNIRSKLPRETRGYIPSFIAANYVMNYYKNQGIQPDRLKFTYFDTDTVAVHKKLTFKQLSKSLNLSIEELRFLNPQYKMDVIPKIKGKQYFLRLPKTKISFFTKHEDEIYGKVNQSENSVAKKEETIYTPSSTLYKSSEFHKVKRGDTLYKIAEKYNLTLEELKALNTKLKSNVLHVGQYVRYKKAQSKS